MARGRRKTESSGYVMNKHKNGKYFYAYSLRPFDEDGKTIYRRCQWGRLDENLKFLPAQSFTLLPKEEKERFVFPDDWDLSELEDTSSRSEKPSGITSNDVNDMPSLFSDSDLNEDSQNPIDSLPDSSDKEDKQLVVEDGEGEEGNEGEVEDANISTVSSDLFSYKVECSEDTLKSDISDVGSYVNQMLCGATWLVEIWVRKIGLLEDLTSAFEGNKDTVDAFMSLVIYALTHNYTLDNFYYTQSYIKYPIQSILKEEELGRIIQSTSNRQIESFFKLWMSRHLEGEVYALDSTLTDNLHSDSNPYGMSGRVFSVGYDVVEALNGKFIMLYSKSSGYPLCYFNYGVDSEYNPSLLEALKDLRDLGAKDYVFFTNRGLTDTHLQVELLASTGQRLMLMSDTSTEDMVCLIDKIEIKDHFPTNMHWDEKWDVYYQQVRRDEELGRKVGHDVRINLFYSAEKDMRDRMRIQRRISHMRSNVERLAGQPYMVISEDFSKANNLIDLRYSAATSDYKFSVVESGTVNTDKVKELTKLCGFFASRSYNLNMNPKQILDMFRFASERTKDFGIMKDMLNLQRTYTDDRLPSLNKIIKGKRFLLFLALIISSSLRGNLNSRPLLAKTFKDDTEMIMEMLSLKGYYKGGKLVACAPLTPRQRLIARELCLDQCPGSDMCDVTNLFYQILSGEKLS